MRQAIDLLSQYAQYHRDERNIATHFVGVPMIVFAAGVLLARPSLEVANLMLTPAWIVFAFAAAWYLTRGHLLLGAATSAAIGLLTLLAHKVAGGGLWAWLGWGLGFFLVGGAIEAIGH